MSRPPHRMCAGCRRALEKRRLLRLTVDRGRIRIDPKGRLPGRGLYVCRDDACITLAQKRRALSRWVSSSEADAAFSEIRRVLGAAPPDREARLLARVGLAHRGGFVAIGLRAALHAMAAGEGSLLVTARDISTRGAVQTDRAAREAAVPHLIIGTRSTLGSTFGRRETVAVLITDRMTANGLLEAAEGQTKALTTEASSLQQRATRG